MIDKLHYTIAKYLVSKRANADEKNICGPTQLKEASLNEYFTSKEANANEENLIQNLISKKSKNLMKTIEVLQFIKI
jgi:hypothetical protein